MAKKPVETRTIGNDNSDVVPEKEVELSEPQSAMQEMTEVAGFTVHDASTGEVWDFDTVPAHVKEWSDADLKLHIIKHLSPAGLSMRLDVPATDARNLYTAILDASLGMHWEDWAGQPALRVLTRGQLEKVYVVGQHLYGDRKDAFVQFLKHRHAAMRGTKN